MRRIAPNSTVPLHSQERLVLRIARDPVRLAVWRRIQAVQDRYEIPVIPWVIRAWF